MYTHDVYVDPVSDRQDCMLSLTDDDCCVAQTLEPSERFFMNGQNFGVITYGGVSSPLRSNRRRQRVSGDIITSPIGMHNNGSSIGNYFERMINLPLFYFNITSSK